MQAGATVSYTERDGRVGVDGQVIKKRKKLQLNNTDLVLLALSVASDKMIRTMHMFPEVQFIDVRRT